MSSAHTTPRFQALAEVWSTPAQLANDLKTSGFLTGEPDVSFLRIPLERWAIIREPRSTQTASAGSIAFGYIGRTARKPPSADWGLLLVDEKSSLKVAGPHLRVLAPDAAVDFILHRICAPEWAGESGPIPHGIVAESGVVIGPGATIGAGTVLEAGVRVGAHVRIGRNCRIGAHSRIGDHCVIGDACRLTASVSIGGQGFGFVKYPGASRRQPRLHVGRVLIGDNVRLGAFVAIDRGVFEDTRIESGNALDNIVQVGHNCVVGRDGVFCSFVGLSGSTRVGERVTMAGQVGTKDHVTIGNNVTIAAQSGISCDIEDGSTVKGYPPKPLPQALKIQVLQAKLPELFDRLQALERELEKVRKFEEE